LHSPKRDFDDSSPRNVIVNGRRLPVTVAVHTHPGHHFKKRPRQCGNLLDGEVTASRDNLDAPGEIREVAPAHRCLRESGKFCNLKSAAVKKPKEVPMLSEDGKELTYDCSQTVRRKSFLIQGLF